MLSNDCVIVPGFGGFMAHRVDARYDLSDNSFIPPIRTIGFNPQLKINDSLLIHSYIEAYELSYPEAQQRIEREISEMCEHLDEEGFYELTNIGTLIKNLDGNLEFKPNEAGILTPDYYGLSAFLMPRLESATVVPMETPAVQAAPQTEETVSAPLLAIDETADEEEGNTISIRISWIRNAVAIAAALLAFLLITTPVSNSVTPQMAFSSIQPALHVDSAQADSTLQDSADVDSVQTEQPAADVKEAEAPVATPATPSEVKPEEQHPYYVVVLASQVSMTNAQNYVQSLHQRGYNEARIYTRNKVNRVVYGQYANQAAAYNAVDRLRDNIEFEEAWVMEVKD